MKLLLVLVGLLVARRVVVYLVTFHAVLRMRPRRPEWHAVEAEAVPLHVRDGLRAPLEELETLGFRFLAWMASTPAARSAPGGPLYVAWAFNEEAGAYATVHFAVTPDPLNLFTIHFRTFGTDGRTLLTRNGTSHLVVADSPGLVAVDPYAATTAEQWKAHTDAVHTHQWVPVRPDDPIATALSAEAAEFDARVRDGVLVPTKDGSFVLGWRAAVRMTRRLIAGQRPQTRMRKARLAASRGVLPAVPLEEEVVAYERFEAQTRIPGRRNFLLWLLVGTLALFVAGMVATVGAAIGAVVLAVLIFHEGGHYLAMRAFGYDGTTIFFVPFLGAVATGHKRAATLSETMLVLLAGPLPGLILAAVLVTAGGSRVPWLEMPIYVLIFLNLFNLLPILPLDGGQIVQLLLFGRAAWLDVLLRIASAAAFVLLATRELSPVFVVGAIFAVASLPQGFRLAKVRRRFREARQARPGDPPVRALFETLRASGFGNHPFAKKVALARPTLHLAQSSDPHWGKTLAWLSIYAAAGAVGVYAGVAAIFASPRERTAAHAPAPSRAAIGTLACSSPVRHAQGDPSTRDPRRLAAVGVFQSPEDAEVASRQLSEPMSASPVGPLLFVWALRFQHRDRSSSRDAWKGDIEAQHRVELDRIAPIARAASGRVVDTGPFASTVSLACEAGSEAEAARIRETVENYTAVAGLWAWPPWAARADLPPEARAREEVARRTYRVMSRARTRQMMAEVERHSTWHDLGNVWNLWFGDGTRGMRDMEAELAATRQAAIAAVDRARATGPVDEEVVRLFLEGASAAARRDGAAEEALEARLGTGDPSHKEGHVYETSRAGSRVSLELSAEPDGISSLADIVAWLCARGCGDAELTSGPRVVQWPRHDDDDL